MILTVWITKDWLGHWRLYAHSKPSKAYWLGTFPSPEMARHAQAGFISECRQKGVTVIIL